MRLVFILDLVVQLNHTSGFVVVVWVTQGKLTLSSLKINARHKHCLFICANISSYIYLPFSRVSTSFDGLVVSTLPVQNIRVTSSDMSMHSFSPFCFVSHFGIHIKDDLVGKHLGHSYQELSNRSDPQISSVTVEE